MSERPRGAVEPPRSAAEQEFRFAVVMYGGVSLAVYINGVAQELFRLVKATAPERGPEGPAADGRLYYADEGSGGVRPELAGSEQVYRELGRWLGLDGASPPAVEAGEPAAVRTRFVVDIVSGTSAGGINGILLARAIANREDFGLSAGLWLDVADIGALLQGPASWGDIPAAARHELESLLNGQRLYWEARRAMTAMREARPESPGDPAVPHFAEQLELATTATDLAGLAVPVRLGANRFVSERVHRKALRFEYGTVESTGEAHSDFDGNDLMLAFAARATSSFPFAFEPVRLADLEPLDERYAELDPAPWFEGYDDPAGVFLADGGYLDNKPFSYATQALRRRRADVPVTRRLLYVEPDPVRDDAASPAAGERPDVYRNILDAMVALPRAEPIRQDIADVAARNRAVARLRDIELDAEALIEADGDLDHVRDGPPYRAYRTLRARIVLDRLAELAGRLGGWAGDDARETAARDALRAWSRGVEDLEARTEALDADFRQRRLSFLQDRANDLLRGGERARRMAALARTLCLDGAPASGEGVDGAPSVGDGVDEAPSSEDGVGARARAPVGLKEGLNHAFDDLRRAERATWSRTPSRVLDAAQLERLDAVRAAAAALTDQPEPYVESVERFLERPLRAADEGIGAALAGPTVAGWIRALLTRYDERFELFDLVVLPLAYPDLGEINAVEIQRVSPLDAPGIAPTGLSDPAGKLTGVRVKHFGAFLERSWRENDLLWGRLDGAEAITDAVLPDPAQAELRERFRVRAQAAILREALGPGVLRETLSPQLAAPASEQSDRELVSAFRQRYTPPAELAPARAEALAGASLGVAGRVFARHAVDHHLPRWPLDLMSRGGPLLARVAVWRARLGARLRPGNDP